MTAPASRVQKLKKILAKGAPSTHDPLQRPQIPQAQQFSHSRPARALVLVAYLR
jgi:hypothetical protein